MRKCLECGADSEWKLCDSCKERIYPTEKVKVEILFCKFCCVYSFRGKWVSFENLKTNLIKWIKNKYFVEDEKMIQIEMESEDLIIMRFVNLEGSDVLFEFNVKKTQCKKCSRMRSSYFTTVIQFRNCSREVLDFGLNYLEKNKASVSKILKVRGGFDVYVDNKKIAYLACKVLKKKHGGVVKTSSKLYGQEKQTSKLIYRYTILFKKFPFAIGDHFEFEGEEVEVYRLTPDLIVKNSKGKKEKLKYNFLERLGVF